MKKINTLAFVFIFSVFFSLKAMAIDAEWRAASAVVDDTTQRVIAMMEDRSLLLEENSARLNEKIETIVTPFIDFHGFGRGVMGRFARNASDAELNRFADVLKGTLVRTYTMAVSQFTVRSYEIIPPRAPSPRPEMQIVNVQLTSTEGKTYNMLYYMRLVDNKWMLVNVAIEGINIRLTFQNQFADMYQTSRSISAVIDNWEEQIASTVDGVVNDVDG